MANNIYEIFNKLSLNEEEFSSINDNLTDLEKRKIKMNVKKKIQRNRNRYVKAAVASLICISVIGTLIVKPTFADAIIEKSPFLDTVYKKLGYYKNYKDFSPYLGMNMESEGYQFTIDKLIADEYTVLVGIKIYKKGMNKNAAHINYNNIRKYKLDASNYCLEYYDLNNSIEYTYSITIPGNKAIESKPLEVNLK